MKLFRFILMMQFLFLTSWASADNQNVVKIGKVLNNFVGKTDDLESTTPIEELQNENYVKTVSTQNENEAKLEAVLNKITEKTDDLASDFQEHNVTDVDEIHQMTDNFFRNIIVHIPHLFGNKFGRSGGVPEVSEEFQLIKQKIRDLVVNAKKKAEELLVKVKKLKITDESQIKAMTRDLIKELKYDFDPKIATRRSRDIDLLLEAMEEITSYKDFASDLEELNLDKEYLVKGIDSVYRILSTFEEEARALLEVESDKNRLTVANLLGEDSGFSAAAKIFEKIEVLAKVFVKILKEKFTRPGIIPIIAYYLNGLNLNSMTVQLIFPSGGNYIPYIQKALMEDLGLANDDPDDESIKEDEEVDTLDMEDSDLSLESENLRKDRRKSLDDPKYPKFSRKMHPIRNDILKDLKMDSKYIDALRSLGLGYLKLVVVDVPVKKSMENTLYGEMQRVNRVPMVNFNTILPEPRHSSATLEHNQKALLKIVRGIQLLKSLRNMYMKPINDSARQYLKIKEELNDRRGLLEKSETRSEQRFRHPDYVKFANEASNLGIPQFNDVNKSIKYFWKPNQYQG